MNKSIFTIFYYLCVTQIVVGRMNRTWLAPLSLLYGVFISIRNKLFDWRWLPVREYEIPIVCVGNLTVGGTGKTPVSEMLIEHFSKGRKVALLSRGYGRRTKGYREVSVNSSFLDVGDEPKQIKLKFPECVVVVCEKRVEGIKQIREQHPEVNLIILDDGFQHRYVKPWVNIIIMDYTRPIYNDHLLPRGQLRDSVSQLHRALFVIVTKCPPNMSAIDRRIVLKSLKLYPYQSLYFSSMKSQQIEPMFEAGKGRKIDKGTSVVAMSGIGNPRPFIDGLKLTYSVVDTLTYPDHHPYRRRDLETMRKALEEAPDDTIIVATEKDAVKLYNSKKIPEYLRERLFYVPIKLSFNEDSAERSFLKKIDYDVKTNPKNRSLYS